MLKKKKIKTHIIYMFLNYFDHFLSLLIQPARRILKQGTVLRYGQGKRGVRSTATPTTLNVDFCTIRGLHSNLNAVHHHLGPVRPALLFLTETQIHIRHQIQIRQTKRQPIFNIPATKQNITLCLMPESHSSILHLGER